MSVSGLSRIWMDFAARLVRSPGANWPRAGLGMLEVWWPFVGGVDIFVVRVGNCDGCWRRKVGDAEVDVVGI